MLHQVGVGALGPVFRTYEPTRDRLVAVKVFRLDITPEQAQALADELSKPADADDIYAALTNTAGERAAPPENPMSADRVRWEHIQRVYEMCERNVSETARRLNMHRRTLQRILAKRAPR